MGKDVLREIARLVIADHMSKGPCLFAPTAVEDIAAAGEGLTGFALLDALEEAVLRTEIYCPHEGVDRRAEFGL